MRPLLHRTLPVLLCGLAALAPAFAAAPAHAQCCTVPDNGFGTATMPPGCTYLGAMRIVDGLAPGDTIKIDAAWGNFAGVTEGPGGTMGGTLSQYASQMAMQMTGTGSLAAFNRFIVIPLNPGSSNEIHSAPRTAFAPVQTFSTVLYSMNGQILGDPDFDLLRITGGNGFGMPSPGSTTFTQSGSNWAVNSFFDVFHRVDFVGAPGGDLAGRSGSTTWTHRFSICPDDPVPAAPTTWGRIKALQSR